MLLLGRFRKTGEQSIKSLQQATDLYVSLNNPSGAGRSMAALAFAYRSMGHTQEARRIAQTALTVCEAAGDSFGKALALNNLAIIEGVDRAISLKLMRQAQQAFEVAGNLGGLSSVDNNLGYNYCQLGLYPRALRYYQKCLAINPTDSYPLSNITDVEIEMSALDMAHQHVAELSSIERGNNIQAFTEELLGRIALSEGSTKVAINHFKRAIQISHEAGLAREIGELALLGHAYQAQGNVVAALKSTFRAAKMHSALEFPEVDDHPSQKIWWRHTLALQANHKTAEAREALKTAYDFLLQGIASLRDVGLRRNYLNKVTINKEIIQAWFKESVRRRLPDEQRFAHLAVESSLREPFERLAEISLRTQRTEVSRGNSNLPRRRSHRAQRRRACDVDFRKKRANWK